MLYIPVGMSEGLQSVAHPECSNAVALQATVVHFLGPAASMDDAIGTVKMWNGYAAAIPRGWREYTALQGKFPVGYKSGDADFGGVGATGGAKTHVHGSGSTSGSGAGASAGVAASNLPPFSSVIFIERYQ
jgi:hypothetical protein